MEKYFTAKALLSPPTERAAFSDRQAYVCAELSKLAYFKFEGNNLLEEAIGAAKTILGDDWRMARLEGELRRVIGSAPTIAGTQALQEILKGAEFELVETFSEAGTQAFLCTRSVALAGGTKTVAFLAFRGTEKDIRDIKTDVSASLEKVPVGGEMVELHSGYLDNFRLVQDQIKDALAKMRYDQLFVTGHSLGGALAVVATVLLGDVVNGACYTFGAPPIGAATAQDDLKTPIYEIVNEVDIVPRLPNPWWSGPLLFAFRLIRNLVQVGRIIGLGGLDRKVEQFLKGLSLYRHTGYMSYLVGKGDDAHLRFNVSSFDQVQWWVTIGMKDLFGAFKKLGTDHFMDTYLDKIRVHAIRRQQNPDIRAIRVGGKESGGATSFDEELMVKTNG